MLAALPQMFIDKLDLEDREGRAAAWKRGDVVEASWAIYANHGGGYSYRLCKKDGNKPVTEIDCQKIPLDFVGNRTEVRFEDQRKIPIMIDAVSTNVGTFPQGSMWRKNPMPMCNCDVGGHCSYNSTKDMFLAYKKTHFRPGQTNKLCPTGLHFESQCDECVANGGNDKGYTMVDKVQIPHDIEAGDYVVSWRWDCEETAQG